MVKFRGWRLTRVIFGFARQIPEETLALPFLKPRHARLPTYLEKFLSPARPRHHPDIPRTLKQHHRNSPTRGRPSILVIRQAPVKVPHREGFTRRAVGLCIQPLRPQAVMPISPRREIQSLPIRRPIGPVFGPFFRDRDPGALGHWFRPIERRNHDPRPIRPRSARKTDPPVIR